MKASMAVFLLLVAAPVMSLAAQTTSTLPAPRIMQMHSNIFGAVIFWDATPYVERFVAEGVAPKDALASLEVQAVKIFVGHAPALAKTERRLRVIASFSKTGPISARYQTSTLEGIQTIFTLDGNLRPNVQLPKDWEANVQRGIMPSGLKLQVVSEIPKK
ncbi:MAG: hypothetical protein JO233_00215 [Candidatus Eremiobacteraeota bacterium]|nr:hypothetical protein [Candidatus Eremiobacteraeota bacterium]